jgi:hypothetical protein
VTISGEGFEQNDDLVCTFGHSAPAVAATLLADHGRIELRNFGVFECRERKARVGRNPKTGESVDVPAKFVVTFKPGKEMEEKIREANPVGWNLETFQLPQGETPTPSDSDNSEQSLPPI